jgi:hypothetical protein
MTESETPRSVDDVSAAPGDIIKPGVRQWIKQEKTLRQFFQNRRPFLIGNQPASRTPTAGILQPTQNRAMNIR